MKSLESGADCRGRCVQRGCANANKHQAPTQGGRSQPQRTHQRLESPKTSRTPSPPPAVPTNTIDRPNGRQLRVALTNPPPTGSETCTNMIGWLTPNPALPFNPLAQLRSEAGFPRSRALSSTTSRRSLASVPYRQDRVTTRPVGGIRQHALGMLQPSKLQIEGCLTPATSAAL